jgi:hypothetical protein
MADVFWAIIAMNLKWIASPLDNLIERPNNTLSRQ